MALQSHLDTNVNQIVLTHFSLHLLVFPNGNMETGSPPSSWTADNSTAAVAEAANTLYDVQSLKITETAPAMDGYIYQSVSVSANTNYNFSVWASAINPGSTAGWPTCWWR